MEMFDKAKTWILKITELGLLLVALAAATGLSAVARRSVMMCMVFGGRLMPGQTAGVLVWWWLLTGRSG